jgi:hypothetical protein
VAGPSGPSPRLLFVLSNDHGELANAMYLLAGQNFEAVFLLPDRLLALNRDALPGPAHRYGSAPDVLDHVRRERPDVVFLFSGYLYGVNDLLPVEAVEALVEALVGADYPVATTDPFLGVLSALDAATFSDRHPRQRWLLEHFARLARVFRTIPHLDLVALGTAAGPPRVAFFNEAILLPPGGLAAHRKRLADTLGLDPGTARWLFVLSAEDYAGQRGLWGGGGRFDEILIERLQETVGQGRQPVLVAPAAAIAAIRQQASAPKSLVALPFCGYDLFTALLLDAEHAFYWNIFSNSILARVLNHRPVFFFDPGHLARAIPPLAEAGLEHYYAGAEPPYLSRSVPLEAGELGQLAQRQEPTLEPARAAFRRSPTPSALVERLRRG